MPTYLLELFTRKEHLNEFRYPFNQHYFLLSQSCWATTTVDSKVLPQICLKQNLSSQLRQKLQLKKDQVNWPHFLSQWHPLMLFYSYSSRGQSMQSCHKYPVKYFECGSLVFRYSAYQSSSFSDALKDDDCCTCWSTFSSYLHAYLCFSKFEE